MRISDWSSDVCSSDLCRWRGLSIPLSAPNAHDGAATGAARVLRSMLSRWPSVGQLAREVVVVGSLVVRRVHQAVVADTFGPGPLALDDALEDVVLHQRLDDLVPGGELRLHDRQRRALDVDAAILRSEEHTSELQSLMRISYAVFCLKKKTQDYDSKQFQT